MTLLSLCTELLPGKNYRKNSVLFFIAGTLPSTCEFGKKLQIFSTIRPKAAPQASTVAFYKLNFCKEKPEKADSTSTKQRDATMTSFRPTDIELLGT
jgi:hypothetical protein